MTAVRDRSNAPRLSQLSEDTLVRFWAKVNKNGPVVRAGLTPCWIWTAATTTATRYGNFTINGYTYSSHRVSLFIERGIDPSDGEACHVCDNRPCINPDHITVADRVFNMKEAVDRGRAKHLVKRGIYHHRAKLTDEIVSEIRSQSGIISQRKLASRYGVSVASIKDIVHWRTWRNPSSKFVETCTAKK